MVILSGQFPGIVSESRVEDRGSEKTDMPSNVGSYIVHSNAAHIVYDCHCTYYRMHSMQKLYLVDKCGVVSLTCDFIWYQNDRMQKCFNCA